MPNTIGFLPDGTPLHWVRVHQDQQGRLHGYPLRRVY